MQRLDPKKTAVVVVDVQDRLAAAMPAEQLERVKRSARILVEAARLLGARVLATEQYPKGLGATVPEVAEALKSADAPCFEKLDFSACDAAGFGERLSGSGVTAAVVLGMETHVCVYQTVRALRAAGHAVHVLADAVASRTPANWQNGLDLCVRTGAVVTNTETVVFDLLGRAGTDDFKVLSRLVK